MKLDCRFWIALCLSQALSVTVLEADQTRQARSAARVPEIEMIDGQPTEASLVDVSIWLSATFGLPMPLDVPQVQRVRAGDLPLLRHHNSAAEATRDANGKGLLQTETGREVVAVYDSLRRTIYVPETWNGQSRAEKSVLIHEMVHHLQNRPDVKYECPAAREKLAYEAQSDWLGSFGLSLEKEFDVDMFTVVALSACMN